VTERLREARESRGLSHRQLADITKVSSRVVAALEEGRLDVVPEGIYRRSLVRLIAAEVGLNAEQTLRDFLAEHPDDLPSPGTGPRVEPAGGAGPAGWRRVLPMIGAIMPLLVGIAYFAAPAPEFPRGPAAPERDSAVGVWRPDIVPAAGFAELPPPKAHPMSAMITVSERCRLQIVADGGLLVGRMFEAGESLRVAFSESVELSGDNAGGVQFSINGRAGRLLGGPGEVLSARLGRDDYPFFLAGR
jgi:transcriptional regulator with XRE-family HTH domain